MFLFSLGGGSKRILWFISKSSLPMLSSKSFMVSSLTFRSLIHFEFMYGVKKCSSFILLHVAVQFSKNTYWETVFSPLYIFISFAKGKVLKGVWVYLWAFYLVPFIYISVFMSVPYCLDYCSFVVYSTLIKLKSVCIAKETIMKMKKQP